MKPIYRSGCEISSHASDSDFQRSVDVCLDWVLKRKTVEAPPSRESARQTLTREPIGDELFLETLRVEDDCSSNWGLVFEHPDADDDRLWWRTEVTLSRSASCDLVFSCANLVGNRDGSVSPIRRPPTRPRIVESLMSLWPGDGTARLSPGPVLLEDSAESIGNFLEFLYSRNRRHPVVLVSARNVDDRPAVDHERVASTLAGLAHTFVATNRFPSLKLKDRLPTQLNCYDGAVRIYWPGFRSVDPPDRHRVWSTRLIKEIESPPYSRPFELYVLERIAGFASFTVREDLPSWEKLQRLNRKQLLTKASSESDFRALADRYAEENDFLTEELRKVRLQLEAKAIELDKSQYAEEYYRQLYTVTQRSEPTQAEAAAPVSTVSEAISRTKVEFSDRLAFALNSKSEEDSPYEQPEEVYSALVFLATTYCDARTGEVPCGDFAEALSADLPGWKYKSGQSDVTMGKYKDWYKCSYAGQNHLLKEHVGTSTNREARYAIRIAFFFDDVSQKVVVGYLGQHQKTDGS